LSGEDGVLTHQLLGEDGFLTHQLLGFVLQVRDYIHVMDLADGHIAALHKLFKSPDIGKNRKSY
jgi:nucleoside-diphosphate-sugar epimerase